MIRIKVFSEANAQALFDAFNGKGVTWIGPAKGLYAHVLIVKDEPCADNAAEFIKRAFPEMIFTCEKA